MNLLHNLCCAVASDRVRNQTNVQVKGERQVWRTMLWGVLCHLVV